MSVSVTKIVSLPQAALKFLVEEDDENPISVHKKTGGIFSDSDYAWLVRDSRLEIIHTKTGSKVGAWTFGWVLKDPNIRVVCVDEIQRPHGRLPLLAVALDCDFNGGMICIFDFFTSKVIRAIHLNEKITNLHVIDSGYDVFTLPGLLRNFDGVIAVGTEGGDVLLIDICRQICDEALSPVYLSEIRDELNPCELSYISPRDLSRIEHHKELAVRNNHHLAIHLNVVFEKSTNHFALKGPKGEDRLHVNKAEVRVSALYYCPQLGSLLVGYNFGALQLYNLMNLELMYTSPVCDEHIPISHFAVQEPTDDPRSVCYVWAVYSSDENYPTCLPLAVMYTFCFNSKEYHDGYGFLYQDFSNAAVHYQMELGIPEGHKKVSKIRGGTCLKLNSITQGAINREGPPHDFNEDVLALTVFVWNIVFSNKETHTFLAVFDLNQWYKEQMPSVMNLQFSSTYMIQMHLNDLINSTTNKAAPILSVHLDKNSIQQFIGAQRLEEHFYPNSLTFGMTCLREIDVIFLHNSGVQKALLAQIESSGSLCLADSAEIYKDIVGLGLVPLFIDLPVNSPVSSNQQKEIILGAALENQLMGWLCKCASEWANGSFLSAGCSLDLLISWAFQRAITLKNNCDRFCVSLFDYSQLRLDNNTNILLNSCTRQLKNLYSLYGFIISKLSAHIPNYNLVHEQYKSLETVSLYFEVLQWLLNVGLLPECPINTYPRTDGMERISAPYPAEMLIEFYNHRRALLKILNEENFSSSESVLFIDALIEHECGGKTLQEQWRNDGGNGLYPPPSLQALLRTYLIDTVDLSYKHLVVIYVFLDLAMTLDQDKYKPVVTHLIKFPAVFKVSPSVIKITQAFWQLDHGDCNSAMGLLLDPLITPEDLTSWHHKTVLRSLMLQKQYNFALLYVQVRKPVLKDDEDVLSVISLFIANDMVNEAFYLGRELTNDSGQNKFLSYFFNECKKKDKLRSLIFRNLSSAEENSFLKYLTSDGEAKCEDLYVYYHILRSRFIEAFESHENAASTQIENKGLCGQERASARDKLVYSLKKLLPDVNRNLIGLCQKEKHNVWQQVSRPTPLSVFVHNLNENVNYKSSIVGAALAKAKETFNETIQQKLRMSTEGTPFLRTPTVSAVSQRSSVLTVNPRVVHVSQEPSDVSPPAKRFKPSPKIYSPIPSKLDTPLVKRRTPKGRESTETAKNATPQSILKVKNLANHRPSRSDGQFEDDLEDFEKTEYTPICVTPKKSSLGLSPRKSLIKHSAVVRFEGVKSSSPSSLDKTRSSSENVVKSDNSADLLGSSKNTSTEDEEVFYSPNASLEDKEDVDAEEKNERDVAKENETLADSVDREDISEEKPSSPVFSPRARRSYKRSLGQMTPVGSSSRLSTSTPTPDLEHEAKHDVEVSSSKSLVDVREEKEVLLSEKIDVIKSSPEYSSPLPKLRPRKSLCRKVLESNALNKVFHSPTRRSTKLNAPEVTSTEESTEHIIVESNRKFDDGREIHKLSFTEKRISTKSLLETDIDTSNDFSFEYSNTEELKLSDSMMKYLNSSDKFSMKNKSSLEENSYQSNIDEEQVAYISTEEENKVKNDELTDNTTDKKKERVNDTFRDISKTKIEKHISNSRSEVIEKNVDDNRIQQDVSVDSESNVSTEDNKNLTQSVFDSSAGLFSMSYEASEPKLSESVLRCINNRDVGSDGRKGNVGDEEMETDDVDEPNEEQPDENVELVYGDLTEEMTGPSGLQTSVEKESSDERSAAPVDPEMNVFEITDDLSYNDELLVEKEVKFEENDLCYDQQSTLESVLEESMCPVSSTHVSALEKNVFSEDSGSERSDDAGEPRLDERLEETGNEVIEIGSSTDEETKRSQDSGGKLDGSYERNIYDSEHDYSSESSYGRRYSEISELSEDEQNDKTEGSFGLFRGDFIAGEELNENCKKSENRCRTIKEEHSNEGTSGSQCRLEDKEKVENGGQMRKLIENEEVIESNDEKKKDLESDSAVTEELQCSYQVEDDVNTKNLDKEGLDSENIIDIQKKEERLEEITDTTFRKDGTCTATDAAEEGNIQHTVTQSDEKIQENSARKLDLAENVENVDKAEENVVSAEQIQIAEEMTLSEVSIKNESNEQNVGSTEKEQNREREEKEVADPRIVREDPSELQNTPSENKQQRKLRTRSSSSSSSQRGATKRRMTDPLELAVITPQREPDVLEDLLKTQKPVRNLRSRRFSVDEVSTPPVALRKRSGSVDEMKLAAKEESSEKEGEVRQRRTRRASSVLHLPKIPEEDGTKKANSVLEGYSVNRRITRKQLSLLQKVDGGKMNLDYLDPMVLLDKMPFGGKPDLEEQKIYDTSPTTTNSTSSTAVKPSRRLRSTSQTSSASQRSNSTTPVSRKITDAIEDVEPNTSQTRVTRSQTKSSNDSSGSENTKAGQRRRRAASQTALPKISEEESAKKAGRRRRRVASQPSVPRIDEDSAKNEEELSTPRKRTRRNLSQV